MLEPTGSFQQKNRILVMKEEGGWMVMGFAKNEKIELFYGCVDTERRRAMEKVFKRIVLFLNGYLVFSEEEKEKGFKYISFQEAEEIFGSIKDKPKVWVIGKGLFQYDCVETESR